MSAKKASVDMTNAEREFAALKLEVEQQAGRLEKLECYHPLDRRKWYTKGPEATGRSNIGYHTLEKCTKCGKMIRTFWVTECRES